MSARLAAALALAGQGIRVLPLHEGSVRPDGKKICTCQREDCHSPGKHPRTRRGVDDATADQSVITGWFKRWPNANVAIATGKDSGLDVLDIDGARGREVLAALEKEHGPLPYTPIAKTGKGLHYFFKHDDRVWNRVGLDENVDVRTTGGYVVAAPSIHVSGRAYEWEVGIDEADLAEWPEWLIKKLQALREAPSAAPPIVPDQIPGDGQTTYTAKVIASVMESMHQARAPQGDVSGNRNSTLNKQAYILGQLVGANEPIGNAEEQLKAIALGKGMRPDEVNATFASGFGDGVKNPKKIRQLEPTPPPTSSGQQPPKASANKLPEICVVAHELKRMTDEGEATLVASKLPIYARFGDLARVREGDGGRLVVDVVPDPQLLLMLSMSARWFKWVPTKGDQYEKDDCLPPENVVRVLSTKGKWEFMELHQVYDAPTMRPDGTVLQAVGYDPMTRAIYRPRITFQAVKDQPTKDDARAALRLLIEPLTDFPFKKGSDLSAWISMLLTIVGRPLVDGATPLFVIRATDRGVGKSLLADIACMIATGNIAARMTYVSDPDEENKRMLSLGRESAPFALLDNVSAPFGGDVLAAATTGRVYKGRDLGHTRMIEVPVPVLCATGVNVLVKDDIGRRVIPIDMDPGVENPEERRNFKYQNVLRWVKDKRAELVVAALTILRAHQVAGAPQEQVVKPFGSFEEWSERIRQAVIWTGLVDPCLGREEIREASDADRDAVLCLLETWHERFSAIGGSTIKDALEIARQRDSELLEAIAGLEPKISIDRLDSRKIANAFQRACGRVVGGYKLVNCGRTKRGVRWGVETRHPTTPAVTRVVTLLNAELAGGSMQYGDVGVSSLNSPATGSPSPMVAADIGGGVAVGGEGVTRHKDHPDEKTASDQGWRGDAPNHPEVTEGDDTGVEDPDVWTHDRE